MKMTFWAAAGVGVLAVGSAALAQCGYTVSLWESFRAGQAHAAGVKQVAGDAYQFRRDGVTGTLLSPVAYTGNSYGWGDPTQPYSVPLAGAVFSPDPLVSQMNFGDRTPGFTGIMMHPGSDAVRCSSIFTAQTATAVSSLDLYTEVLGDISDGVQVMLKLVTAAGTETTLSGPITSLWGQPAQHTPILPFTPFLLAAGDRIVVETSNNGSPSEDWENIELQIHVTASAPVIMAQPRGVATCPGGSVTMSVAAVGAGGPGPLSGYRWQKDGVDVQGETGSSITLSNVQEPTGGRYRCIVSNSCGVNTSAYGTLLVRTADVGQQGGVPGGDGTLDNNDFVVFIDRFFANDARADYGAQGGQPGPDGDFDNNDFIAFIDLFFSGCH